MSPFWRGFVKGFAGADFEGFLLRLFVVGCVLIWGIGAYLMRAP